MRVAAALGAFALTATLTTGAAILLLDANEDANAPPPAEPTATAAAVAARPETAGTATVLDAPGSGGLLRGTIVEPELGLVAGALDVDVSLLDDLLSGGYVPVIAPIATEASNAAQLLNVNADSAAGAIAAALGAAHLVFLTDVDGILNPTGHVIERVPLVTGESLVHSGVVKGGMIPKLEACLQARKAGAHASIVNGTHPRALLACLDGSITGTTVV